MTRNVKLVKSTRNENGTVNFVVEDTSSRETFELNNVFMSDIEYPGVVVDYKANLQLTLNFAA